MAQTGEVVAEQAPGIRSQFSDWLQDTADSAAEAISGAIDKSKQAVRVARVAGVAALALLAGDVSPAGAKASEQAGIGAAASALSPASPAGAEAAPSFTVMPFAPENRPDDKTGNLIKVMRITCTPASGAIQPTNTFTAGHITERINNVQAWFNQRMEGNRALKFDNEGSALDITEFIMPAKPTRSDGSAGNTSCENLYSLGSFSTRAIIDGYLEGLYSPSLKEKMGPNWEKYIYLVFMDMRMRDAPGSNANPPKTPGKVGVVFANQDYSPHLEKLISMESIFTMGLPNRIFPFGASRSSNPKDILWINNGVWSGTQYSYDQLELDPSGTNYRRDLENGFNAIDSQGNPTGEVKLFTEKIITSPPPPPTKRHTLNVGFNKYRGKAVRGSVLGLGSRCVNSCAVIKEAGDVLRIDPVLAKADKALYKVVGFTGCDKVVNHKTYGKRCIETVDSNKRIGVTTAPRQVGVAK